MPEESDASLATFRELARKLGIYLHVGSLAIKVSPDKAANRSFLIDREGEIVARYDKIHMFDVDLAGGESYRESRNYRAGRDCGGRRPAVGPARADRLLRPALSRALPRARRSRRVVSRDSVRLHATDRRGALARADARPRDRERLRSCSRPRRAASTRTAARRSAIRWWSIPWGRVLAEGGTEPGVVMADDRSGRGRGGARAHALAAARPALRDPGADGGADAIWTVGGPA